MSDKILTEAFDKMKAIEESEDPFCVGAKADTDSTIGYNALKEVSNLDLKGDDNYGSDGEDVSNEDGEHSYGFEDSHGFQYSVHFQPAEGDDTVLIKEDGVVIASYTRGGSGAMNAKIKRPEQILDALTAALIKAGS